MARRFRFSLETLLRIRALREREAQRKLGAKQAEIARLDHLNRQTTAEIERCRDALLQQQRRSTLDPQALARERAWIGHLRRTIAQRHAQRADLLAQRDRLQAELREAMKDKRVIEKLRERRLEVHRRVTRRAEQSASDELARQLLRPSGLAAASRAEDALK